MREELQDRVMDRGLVCPLLGVQGVGAEVVRAQGAGAPIEGGLVEMQLLSPCFPCQQLPSGLGGGAHMSRRRILRKKLAASLKDLLSL